MKVREVAARLEISSSLVYQLIDAGKLKCCRVGMGRGVIRVSEEQLTDYLKKAEPLQSVAPVLGHRPKLRHLRIN